MALRSLEAISTGVFSTGGTPKINLIRANQTQRNEHRNGEYSGDDHCPGRLGICDKGHRKGNHDAPGGGEPLVLSEPFRQCRVTNKSKSNSNNARP